ncbi:MAG TPA: hypothetical protein VFD82_18685 [Planctomycetota bacterium]|nr:hypothetical protein [Planctomycetota bacterium]
MTLITSRRQVLAWVGQGMLVAAVGPSLQKGTGLAVLPDERLFDCFGDELDFGDLEPLVAFMQETPLDELIAGLVGKLRSGTDLRTLVAAGALANARTFGGQDYVGFHCAMALAPSLDMAGRLDGPGQPLPVLKVLYRNTQRIRECGGRAREVLRRIPDGDEAAEGTTLQGCVRGLDVRGAEQAFASLMRKDPAEGYEHLQPLVHDDADVHRVVLAWRAWDMLRLCGKHHAHTLLRQSVRYCVDQEKQLRERGPMSIRTLLPQLLDRHGFAKWQPGARRGDDGWLDALSQTVFGASREDAAAAVAEALAAGYSPEDVGEAISLAANKLLLCDPGRRDDRDAQKPRGSVHGASVGVHAQDAANAWREIARVTAPANAAASLIVGAYHTAGQSRNVQSKELALPDDRPGLNAKDSAALLEGARACIAARDQLGTCAFVRRYQALEGDPRAVFDLLLGFAVSEDGALHAEKFYRTAEREFATTRPARRWNHLVALGRVTASEHGWQAGGVARARELLRG